MIKEKLYGKTINDLIAVAKQVRLPGYAAKQMADWIYKQDISHIDEMTNISKNSRKALSAEYEIGLSEPENSISAIDGTRKYLFRVLNDKYIETAYIPEKNRSTICVSSQAGCKLGCIFCMTGKQGFQGNLTANEILNQFRSLPEFRTITNMVYMGMGEPLDNISEVLKSIDILTADWGYSWSPKRITVSTVGLIRHLDTFIRESRCHLAISLHSPFESEREYIMPIQRSNPISKVIEVVKSHDFSHQRRISFEYILFQGFNDTSRHVKEIARILNGLKCRINLIKFHKVPGLSFASPDTEAVARFRDALSAKGIITTIRSSRGEDIQAACGMLSTLEKNKSHSR